MNILILILCAVIAYYTVFLLKFNVGTEDKPNDFKQDDSISNNNVNSEELMGKSLFEMCQTLPPYAIESHKINPIDNTHKFDTEIEQEKPLPIDAEFDVTYEEEDDIRKELELEEVQGYVGDEPDFANGVSFEEISQVVSIISKPSTSENEEKIAVDIIKKIDETNILKAMVEQINGGMEKVAEMLKRNEEEQNKNNGISLPNDISAFNIHDCL